MKYRINCVLLFLFVQLCVLSAQESPKIIALTFDDGPNTTTTPAVLAKLNKYQIRASFFVIGDRITDESALFMKVAHDMGCEVCNHSFTHAHMDKQSREVNLQEIEKTNRLIEQATGEAPKYFRAPYIDINREMYDYIDLTFIYGEDCQDWDASYSAEYRAETEIRKARDGGIILMHDFNANSQTVEALDILIPSLKQQGYEFVTLTELFARKGVQPKRGVLYSHADDTEMYFVKTTN